MTRIFVLLEWQQINYSKHKPKATISFDFIEDAAAGWDLAFMGMVQAKRDRAGCFRRMVGRTSGVWEDRG